MVAMNNKQMLARYQNEFPHYQEFIELMQGVYKSRKENEETLKTEIFSLNQTKASQKLKNGQPLVNLQKDLFADQLPKNYFLELLSITEKNHPEITKELRDLVTAKEDAYAKLVRELFSSQTKRNSGVGEEFDLLPFFLHESLKPFFSRLAQAQRDLIEKSNWSQGICPVCSRPADLSLLREDEGKRSLFCLQCDCEWPCKRIQCPFCGEENQQKLSYFTVDDDHGKYRVNVCDQCQRYIKTIDTRKSSIAVVPEIENLVTLHLDLQAIKEGFQ